MKKLKGIGVSPGIVIGKARKIETDFFSLKEYKIEKSQIEEELRRFHESLKKTEEDFMKIKANMETIIGKDYSEIFSFHLALLKDKSLIEDIERFIKIEKFSAETALKRMIQKITKELSSGKKFTDRQREIFDVFERIIYNLREKYNLMDKLENGIIVAKDLSPTQTVSINKKNIYGFVTSMGTETSHTSIIAKALEIPAVVGVANAMEEIKEGDTLLIDGNEGIVIVNPTPKIVENMKKKEKELTKFKKKIYVLKNKKAVTPDGKAINIYANIEFPEEVETALKYGAEGIGLVRTEYLYLKRKDLPSEEEQFYSYKKIVERMKNRPVIIRTIDVGGDKFVSQFQGPEELNSFLGLRGIRFCLEKRDIFLTQIRAILRAGYFGDLKMMFPMITTKEEIIEAKKIIEKAKEQLREEKIKFKEDMEIGIMIEIPSAALISDELAKEVDFFSIGSNDLIQYTLAVDRVSEKLAYLYQPCHPSILKLIEITIKNAQKNNIKVSICGEMAGNPEIACLLVGMGIEDLSMAPIAIPLVKEKILKNEYSHLKEIAEEVLNYNSYEKIVKFLRKNLK